MARPVLALVTGPPGSGKSTLARRLARGLGWPVVARDAFKERLVAAGSPGPERHHELDLRANAAFFAALARELRTGRSVIAEAAFQHHVWASGLDPVADGLSRDRVVRRAATDPAGRAAHADTAWLDSAGSRPPFQHLALPVPTLEVDASDGYRPDLDAVVTFLREE